MAEREKGGGRILRSERGGGGPDHLPSRWGPRLNHIDKRKKGSTIREKRGKERSDFSSKGVKNVASTVTFREEEKEGNI